MQPLDNERQLIQQAQQKDKEAVALLYDGYVQAIFRYVRYRVESDYEAEELTAEVFVRMVRGLSRYRDEGAPFGAWLYRIAGNLITDHYRGRKRKQEQLSESQVSDETDPFGKAARAEEYARLHRALKQLPSDYQTVLILRFIEELPYEAVARSMNKTEQAARVLQHRALKALGERLGATGVQALLRAGEVI